MSLSPTATAVWSRLSIHHRGRKRGVTCKSLAGSVRIREREARAAIDELCDAGRPICGLPATGYFVAESAAELEETAKFHQSRGLHSLKRAARLRGIPLGELVGQMSLDLLCKDADGPARLAASDEGLRRPSINVPPEGA